LLSLITKKVHQTNGAQKDNQKKGRGKREGKGKKNKKEPERTYPRPATNGRGCAGKRQDIARSIQKKGEEKRGKREKAQPGIEFSRYPAIDGRPTRPQGEKDDKACIYRPLNEKGEKTEKRKGVIGASRGSGVSFKQINPQAEG